MKSANWLLLSFFCVAVLLIGFGVGAAGASPSDPIAIKGYDSVAYFKDGKALKGNESFSFRWHTMTWYFRTGEHRDLFVKNPEKYAPQYDGYCAWAMTESRKAITDPEVWRIVDGKLYLNCSVSAYQKWIKDLPGNIKKADQNWLKIKGGNLKEK
ncbi:MAG: YHS domain-containing (seleno)protein [Geobacteraceae bacterium]